MARRLLGVHVALVLAGLWLHWDLAREGLLGVHATLVLAGLRRIGPGP